MLQFSVGRLQGFPQERVQLRFVDQLVSEVVKVYSQDRVHRLVVELFVLARAHRDAASSSPARRPSSAMRCTVVSVSRRRVLDVLGPMGPDGFMEAYDIEVVGRE